MDIIFIGTGTGIPSARRGSPAVLFLHGKTAILVDSGPGTLRQLEKIGMSFPELDYILFTHLHPDHTGDLVPYLFASRNKTAFNRRNPVRIIGPRGLLRLYENLHAAFGHSVEPPEEIVNIAESPLEKHTFNLPDLTISTFPTHHTPESQGYLFRTNQGTSAAVTGDTGYAPELAGSIKGVDLLITECSFPDSLEVPGHMTPLLAGRLAAEAQAEALALNHFYPEIEGLDITTPIKKIYGGTLYITQDLEKISL